MRAVLSLVLCMLLLAPPVVAQAPDDKLIVPGVRIGKWTLKMTIDDLLRMNGPEVPHLLRAGQPPTLGYRQDPWFYHWDSLDFAADTFDKKKINTLVAGSRGANVPFKTKKGIALESTRSDIFKAYGKPTATAKADEGQSILLYDTIGLGFWVWDEDIPSRTRIILGILIFRPGTARSIWKF